LTFQQREDLSSQRHHEHGGEKMDKPLTIGALARATSVPAKTIRYYEQVDVLPIPRRSPSGYRQYGQRDVHRLLFLRRARTLGLSLQELKSLTVQLDQGLCGTMRPRLLDLVRAQLDTVQQRIVEFQLLQKQLDRVLHRLLTAPPSDHAESCQCLDRDATPSQEGSQQPCTSVLGGNTMDTQQTLDTFTVLPPTSRCDDEHCDCGCGCGVVQLSLPSVERLPTVSRAHDDILKGERD
jgi:DNA-binding transcriptional MerR regulator